jgi:predicted transcriptional regulator
MKELHPIQLNILKNLLFSKSSSYSQGKPDPEMENNQYQFHLEQLIKDGLIEKNVKSYCLTTKGKEFAGRINTDQVKITKQAKISVNVGCVRNNAGEKIGRAHV